MLPNMLIPYIITVIAFPACFCRLICHTDTSDSDLLHGAIYYFMLSTSTFMP